MIGALISFLTWVFLTAFKMVLLLKGVQVLYGLYQSFIQEPVELSSKGKWIVITGATDGIGKALTLEIVRQYPSLNFFILGRSKDKIADVEKEAKSINPKATVDHMVVDFSTATSNDYNTMMTRITALDKDGGIAMLVNNVGLSYPSAQQFDEITSELIDHLIEVNVRSVLRLTHIVYPLMKAKQKGVIYCTGSGSSVVPSDPLYAAYAGTKSCAETFCRSLSIEAQKEKVIVQCHVPLIVTTKMSKVKNPSLMHPSAETYAKAALERLKTPTVDGATLSPYFAHSAAIKCIPVMPEFLWHNWRYNMTSAIRAKYNAKKKDS